MNYVNYAKFLHSMIEYRIPEGTRQEFVNYFLFGMRLNPDLEDEICRKSHTELLELDTSERTNIQNWLVDNAPAFSWGSKELVAGWKGMTPAPQFDL